MALNIEQVQTLKDLLKSNLTMEDVKAFYIIAIGEKHNWNRTRMANESGLSLRGIRYKLNRKTND